MEWRLNDCVTTLLVVILKMSHWPSTPDLTLQIDKRGDMKEMRSGELLPFIVLCRLLCMLKVLKVKKSKVCTNRSYSLLQKTLLLK